MRPRLKFAAIHNQSFLLTMLTQYSGCKVCSSVEKDYNNAAMNGASTTVNRGEWFPFEKVLKGISRHLHTVLHALHITTMRKLE